MTRRTCTLTLLSMLLALSTSGSAQGEERPNFLFVLVDDLGWRDLGCYGSTFYDTPHLDALAASGMRFTQGYAAHPVCSPTRAAIMTGKNPARVGITDWIPGRRKKGSKLLGPDDLHALPLEEKTIAEALRDKGYRTFFAGKWHLGGEGHFPEDQGFEINKGGHHRGSPPGGYYTPYKNPKLEDGPEGEYLPDRLTLETIDFIEKHREEPFLAYLSFYTVHTPIQACKRHIEKYRKKASQLPEFDGPAFVPEHDARTKVRQDRPDYASMVHAMDQNVGRILTRLEQWNLDERTVVIFTSDNGGLSTLPPRRNAPTCNLPLRAGKGWCYEGGIRVPFIIRAPGVTKPGSTCDVPVYSADLYPTMLALAGLPLHPEQHRDAESLLPLLRGGDSLSRDFLVWHYPHYHGSNWRPGSAIRSGYWKLIHFYEDDTVELYNLGSDEREHRDLAVSEPGKVAALRLKMKNYLESVGAKFPRPNPDAE